MVPVWPSPQVSPPKFCSTWRRCRAACSASGQSSSVSGRAPVGQRRRRDDHLERRAGRVGLVDRPVEQRVVGRRRPACCTGLGSSSGRARTPGWGRTTGCWPWPGSRRCSGRARPPRRAGCRARVPRPAWALRLRVSTTLPPTGSRPVSRSESRLVNSRSSLPEQEAVLGLLDPGGAVDERVEAGDRRVRRAAGVRAAGTSACRRSSPTRRPAAPSTTIVPRWRSYSSSSTRGLPGSVRSLSASTTCT